MNIEQKDADLANETMKVIEELGSKTISPLSVVDAAKAAALGNLGLEISKSKASGR